MTKKLKKRLKKIILGTVLFILAVLCNSLIPFVEETVLGLILFLIAYFVIGGDVIKKACMNIAKGQIFDENFLMLIATVGAFFVGEYHEAVAVMVFYQVGEWFQAYAVNNSRKSIKELMNIRPDYANVLRDEKEEMVSPEEVAIEEVIVVKPGERIPLDGIVVKGSTTLDTMALTGESMPREAEEGDTVISGCINLTGVLYVKVTKLFADSTVSKILDLVENASSKKAETENFISRFAKYYTPGVVIAAALLAILPPFIFGQPFSVWIYRALSFLVISCPCALVISIPLSFFGGLGGASKAGILVKGSTYLEQLAKAEIVVMDKTGTLTKGNFSVKEVVPAMADEKSVLGNSSASAEAGGKSAVVISAEELLELTAIAECHSKHPISLSIKKHYGKEVDTKRLMQVEEIAGFGVKAVIDGIVYYVGNDKLMQQMNIAVPEVAPIGTVVYTAKEDAYLGYILIMDEEKEDAALCISGLKKNGVKNIVMLTGDRKEAAAHVAKKLGITEYHAELLPADKVTNVEKLFSKKSDNGKLIFVGDGINDAPVLARADIGIAMGGLGSDAAIEAADIVIMTDEPSKIVKAMEISKKTVGIVHQNIALALGIKFLVLILAALGFASMWAAVFADVGVAFLAILNAMRAMKVPE
ncbi:MAG: heavy metal translocating P-type ATPase [Lachnospiraceae bacterium]|nr:heavy metal translocating P-type ATPase [Lachnospiraceae bacterium]